MSFYTNRGQAAFVFVLGCEESRNPAKKGRENEFVTLCGRLAAYGCELDL